MSLRKKLLLLMAWWLGCGASAVMFYENGEQSVFPGTSAIFRVPDATVGKNETGSFSIGRFDPSAGCKPAFHIAWSNLLAENGRLSVFNTPMYKTVVVNDLDVRLYSYFYPAYSPVATDRATDGESHDDAPDFHPGPRTFAHLSPPHSDAVAKTAAGFRPAQTPYAARTAAAMGGKSRGAISHSVSAASGRSQLSRSDSKGVESTAGHFSGLAQALSGAAEELRSGLKGFEVQSPALIDVSNATKVIIRNLNYSALEDGNLDLGVRCANATLSNPGSEVVLRGCVVITTGDGSKLMSNCVRWDPETNQFTVPDTYVLNRGGPLVRGRGIRCDGHLEPLRASQVRVEEPMPVYRFYSTANGSHFYTIRTREMKKLTDRYSEMWKYEEIAWYAYLPDQRPSGTRPVYLLRWIGRNTYFLTMNESEKDRLLRGSPGVWTCDGVAFYAYPEDQHPSNAKPVYRFWSNTLLSHFYTMSESERDKLVNQFSQVWTYEGIAWHALMNGSKQEIQNAR